MTLLGLGLALAAGCFTNFEKVDTSAGGSGGVGGTASSSSSSGPGGSSGTTGGGGTGGSCEPAPTDCAAATVLVPFSGAGSVRVTDAIRDADRTLMVGTFTGVVTFKDQGQHNAIGSADGFLYEVDDDGVGTRLVLMGEADASSVLHVAQHQLDEDILVAGTFNESNATCPGLSKGIFFRRIGQGDAQVFGDCIDGGGAEEINLNDIAFGEANWSVLVGDYRGNMLTKESSSVDGFAISIDGAGAVDADFFVVGGEGDASIRAVEENFVGNLQWLIAGDFSGALLMQADGQQDVVRDAMDERHLFLATVDDAPVPDANLEAVTFGGMGANHRLVDLGLLGSVPLQQRSAVLLAEVEGEIVVDRPGTSVASTAAVAITFDVSSGGDSTETFGNYQTVFLRGAELSAYGVQPRGDSFAITGQALGPLHVEGDGGAWGTIPNPACVRDLFFVDVLDLDGAEWSDQRCGDAEVRTTAMAPGADDGFVTAVTVPDEANITLGGTEQSGPKTLLVTLPKLGR